MSDDFNGFGLPAKLLQALARKNFLVPTPIQIQAIPLALEGRDILGSAQTGTGKTGAFGIPLIAHLMNHPEKTALVMTPTRELASQVLAEIQTLINDPSIKTALLIGGDAMPRQFRQLQNAPRLVVGTPGRINDHLERGSLKLDKAAFLVLDETDRMLDMGFGIQIERIVNFMPKERQTMLFSATIPQNIAKLSSKYLKNPERISVGSTTTPVERIKQELVQTTDEHKYGKLIDQLKAREGSVIIFVKTKFGTERLADRLNKENMQACAIHGDLQQRRRERVISSFRDKCYRIMVATDVAARGLDIPHIAHVINYDLPQCPEDYIHRIGRTARAGAEGSALNFLTPADGAKWQAIHRLIHGKNDPTVGRAANDENAFKSRRRFAGKPFGKPASKPSHAENDNASRDENGKRKFFDKSKSSYKGGSKFEGPKTDKPFSKPGFKKPFGKKPFGKPRTSEKSAA